jgi:hypothetical protein
MYIKVTPKLTPTSNAKIGNRSVKTDPEVTPIVVSKSVGTVMSANMVLTTVC